MGVTITVPLLTSTDTVFENSENIVLEDLDAATLNICRPGVEIFQV